MYSSTFLQNICIYKIDSCNIVSKSHKFTCQLSSDSREAYFTKTTLLLKKESKTMRA